MGLPTLSKTWQFNVNNTEVSAAELTWHQTTLYNMKTAMIGFASNPWTVVGSSDSTAASMDATDRWSSSANLVWGTGVHSWIVLANSTGAQLCFDLKYTSSNPQDADIYFSVGGNFTGGTTSARPTAADEFNALTGTDPLAWFGNSSASSTLDMVWHMLHSNDGEETRIIGFDGNVPHTVVMIGKFENARTGQASPYYCGWYTGASVTTDVALVTAMGTNSTLRYSSYDGGEFGMSCAGLGLHTSGSLIALTQASVKEEIDSEAYFYDLSFYSTTVGYRGPKGQPPDVWWGQYQVVSDGDTYPDNASVREFFQVGHLVFPWTGDSTVPVTA